MVKVRKKQKTNDVCEMSLLIEKDEQIVDWDDQDLIQSIMEEVEIAESTAKEIAEKVKVKLKELCETMGWESASSDLIREMVVNEIVAKGKKYKNKVEKYGVIGLSPCEIKAIVENVDGGENSNVIANNPEAINFNIAEIVFKKYMLQEVFSNEVSSAHYSGMIHLHDAASPRYYCGSHSILYIAKNGLKIPTVSSVSKPASHAEVLVNHLLTFSSMIQSQYAGAQGYDAVNFAFAPYLIGMSYAKIKQIAQLYTFGFSQLSTSRGNQCIFQDSNLYVDTPDHLKNEKIIGPKGKYYKYDKIKDTIVEVEKKNASTYEDIKKYAQQMLYALMEVYQDGDKNGLPFIFPKPLIHFNNKCFLEENRWLVEKICECASVNGTPYFVFDRGKEGDVQLAQCCRLKEKVSPEVAKTFVDNPENIRFTAMQNITINLPQCALRAKIKNDNIEDIKKNTVKNIKKHMDIALMGHKEKYKYLKKLYNIENGPLSFSKNGIDGNPYVKMENMTFLMGILGLNECVQTIFGKQLHESEEVFSFGMYIIAEMKMYCDKLGNDNGMKIVLEESPAESASQRLCHIDINNKEWGNLAKSVAKGDLKNNNCYWTNSVHLANEAGVDYLTRIREQSKFHPLISGGAIVHVFCSENLPSKESIYSLINKIWDKTECEQITITPEFSNCTNCGKTELGLKEKCSKCGGVVDWYTRIVGYFSKIQGWSKNKKEELKHREKNYSVEF